MEDVLWWLKEKKGGIWTRPIQAEETSIKGWFLYSHRNIDVEHLTDFLKNELGVQVGLRF